MLLSRAEVIDALARAYTKQKKMIDVTLVEEQVKEIIFLVSCHAMRVSSEKKESHP